MIKTLQLDNEFIPVTNSNLPTLKAELQNKELIAFNAPFEQTQLSRAGFDVWSNDWLDVSLLTKLYDNRLAEERISSLEDLEERLLGTNTKKALKAKLKARYGKNFDGHPDIVNDPPFPPWEFHQEERWI